jgi:hypothetical protein
MSSPQPVSYRLPQPLSATGEVTHDPVTRSVFVRPAERGLAWLVWQQGHQAMIRDDGSISGPRTVLARLGNRDVGRGEAVRDGWLRFQLEDADYRKLARQEGVHAIVTVDRQRGTILSVRFIG